MMRSVHLPEMISAVWQTGQVWSSCILLNPRSRGGDAAPRSPRVIIPRLYRVKFRLRRARGAAGGHTPTDSAAEGRRRRCRRRAAAPARRRSGRARRPLGWRRRVGRFRSAPPSSAVAVELVDRGRALALDCDQQLEVVRVRGGLERLLERDLALAGRGAAATGRRSACRSRRPRAITSPSLPVSFGSMIMSRTRPVIVSTSQAGTRPWSSIVGTSRCEITPLQRAGEHRAHLLVLVRREEVDDPVHGLDRVDRVQRAQHEVAGLGRAERGARPSPRRASRRSGSRRGPGAARGAAPSRRNRCRSRSRAGG